MGSRCRSARPGGSPNATRGSSTGRKPRGRWRRERRKACSSVISTGPWFRRRAGHFPGGFLPPLRIPRRGVQSLRSQRSTGLGGTTKDPAQGQPGRRYLRSAGPVRGQGRRRRSRHRVRPLPPQPLGPTGLPRGALRQGLPIGSGEIESAHRYVIQKRLKLSGAWWTPDHVEAMLALRLNRANSEWQAYWQRLEQQAA